MIDRIISRARRRVELLPNGCLKWPKVYAVLVAQQLRVRPIAASNGRINCGRGYQHSHCLMPASGRKQLSAKCITM